MRDPNLDLFRSSAIAAVVAYHTIEFFPYGLAQGWVGVDIFFCLSGFLIGNVFLKAHFSNARGVFRFWGARWFRTLPPYYAILIGGLIASSLTGHPWPPKMFTLRPTWMYFVFWQNMVFGLPFAFSPTWSLCVEEQFYAGLPLLFGYYRRTSTRVMLLGGVILLANAWRFEHAINPNTLIFRGDALAYGVLIALAKNKLPLVFSRVQRPLRKLLLPLSLTLILLIIAWSGRSDVFLCVFNVIFAAVLVGGEGGPPLPFARSRINHWIARISYSIYLTHRWALLIADKACIRLGGFNLAIKAVMLIASVLLVGLAGYFFLEKPSYWARKIFLGKGESFTTEAARHRAEEASISR